MRPLFLRLSPLLLLLVAACASGEEADASDAAVGAGSGGTAGQGGSGGSAGSAGGSAGSTGGSTGGSAGKAGGGGSLPNLGGAGAGAGSPGGAGGSAGKAGGGGEAGAGSFAGCGPEICGNGSDDNCDGKIDEECGCIQGAVSSCFGAPLLFRNKGVCKDGITQCVGPAEFTEWTECAGDVLPGVEVCDAEQLDEDCDGTANEGCECDDGSPPVPCGSDVGECKKGLQSCINGKLGPCEGAVDPTPEVCDSKDNDCDGQIDEAVSRPCGDKKGACKQGFQLCEAGQWGECQGDIPPTDEVCDGLDNDCDGEVDEEVVATCGTSTGACKIGARSCADGALGACTGAVDPIEEACNGLDDDCDGEVDEGLTVACGSDEGECKKGTSSCVAGAWTPCQGEVKPQEEACDGKDNDCDGTTDEGCGCLVGSAPVPCGSDVGECKKGLQACIGGKLGPCVGAVLPEPEACDNKDNDCDGKIDNDVTEICGSAVGACKQGARTCDKGVFGACVGAVDPAAEQCNGLDDDCDGLVDEGLVRACGSAVGRCVAGTETCDKGAWGACVGAIGPIPEVCEGAIDEDCDGNVDNGCACAAGSTRACGLAVGVCKQGQQTCDAAGQWGPCAGSIGPSAEVCDGLDNNCNGAADEGCACVNGETRLCGSNVGQCSFGVETCDLAGQWGPCKGGVGPAFEQCDGKDNDCDGQLDEGCACVNGQTQSCGSDIGQCKQGKQTCNLAGQWGPCSGGVGPTAEVCNGLDDDCDSKADEDISCASPPTATCSGNATTAVGTQVTLTGSGADPDGGTVQTSWSVTARPGGSTAQPTAGNVAQFTPDQPGTYELTFCVTDDEGVSTCCKTQVTATSNCSPPPNAPAVEACGTSWDRRPIIEFTPLPAGHTYEIFQTGVAAPLAKLSQVGQNYYRPAAPLGAGAPPPGAPVELHVRSCKADNPACCSESNKVSPMLVESCTTAISPTKENVLFSEYVIKGLSGTCPGPSCQAGEAIEITNLSHCPVKLEGHHFSYQNLNGGAFRWMNFTAADVIPPRGVYVAIRAASAALASPTCPLPFFGPDDPGIFGLKISALQMQGDDINSGWFNNQGGSQSTLRLATGSWQNSITLGTTIAIVAPYTSGSSDPICGGVGFDAINACGDVATGAPYTKLAPNQLGRLWRPCDSVVNPVPSNCQLP